MSHHCHFLFYGENIYSPSNFQVYNTVLLTIIMLYIRRDDDKDCDVHGEGGGGSC